MMCPMDSWKGLPRIPRDVSVMVVKYLAAPDLCSLTCTSKNMAPFVWSWVSSGPDCSNPASLDFTLHFNPEHGEVEPGFSHFHLVKNDSDSQHTPGVSFSEAILLANEFLHKAHLIDKKFDVFNYRSWELPYRYAKASCEGWKLSQSKLDLSMSQMQFEHLQRFWVTGKLQKLQAVVANQNGLPTTGLISEGLFGFKKLLEYRPSWKAFRKNGMFDDFFMVLWQDDTTTWEPGQLLREHPSDCAQVMKRWLETSEAIKEQTDPKPEWSHGMQLDAEPEDPFIPEPEDPFIAEPEDPFIADQELLQRKKNAHKVVKMWLAGSGLQITGFYEGVRHAVDCKESRFYPGELYMYNAINGVSYLWENFCTTYGNIAIGTNIPIHAIFISTSGSFLGHFRVRATTTLSKIRTTLCGFFDPPPFNVYIQTDTETFKEAPFHVFCFTLPGKRGINYKHNSLSLHRISASHSDMLGAIQGTSWWLAPRWMQDYERRCYDFI